MGVLIKKDKQKITRTSNSYMRYAALGTELMVLLFLGVWGGLKLDEWLKTKPLFLIALPLIGLVVAFYQLYKSLMQNKEK